MLSAPRNWPSTIVTPSRSSAHPPTGDRLSTLGTAGGAVVRVCNEFDCPIVPAGHGACRGCSPLSGGVVLMLTRMNASWKSASTRRALAQVEPGVINLQLTRAAAGTGYLVRPPIPSSQGTSTIGGNVATNAGGRTLKRGVTANHIAGLEIVLPKRRDRRIRTGAGPGRTGPGAVVCGSEGTLAIVTKIWARLTLPEACRTVPRAFHSRSTTPRRS